MNERISFSDLPVPGAPADDPCHFRVVVIGASGKRFEHHVLIDEILALTSDEVEGLGKTFQGFLRAVKWGDDPEQDFDEQVLPVLEECACVFSPDSLLVAKEKHPELGVTFTSIGIADRSDYYRLAGRIAGNRELAYWETH